MLRAVGKTYRAPGTRRPPFKLDDMSAKNALSLVRDAEEVNRAVSSLCEHADFVALDVECVQNKPALIQLASESGIVLCCTSTWNGELVYAIGGSKGCSLTCGGAGECPSALQVLLESKEVEKVGLNIMGEWFACCTRVRAQRR